MRLGRAVLALGIGTSIVVPLPACEGSRSSVGSVEKRNITVDTLAVPDAAPLFLAIRRGYFRRQGLTVRAKIIQASQQASPGLAAGTVDFSILNYVTTLGIQARGSLNVRFVADSYAGAKDMWPLLVRKNSPIRSVRALKGKRVAINAPMSVGTLTLSSPLHSAGLTMHDIKPVSMGFPQMEEALKTRQVDAIYVLEPFATATEQDLGARVLADGMTGATAAFPLAGWGTTAQYVRKYPKTVAAFQRAMSEGQRLAASSRKAVEKVLPSYTKISRKAAAVITLGTYPTNLSSARLQRVADLMYQQHYLHKKLHVKPLIVPEPKS